MKLTKCQSGHFYDEEKYANCPYCSTGDLDGKVSNNDEDDRTVPIDSAAVTPSVIPITPVPAPTPAPAPVPSTARVMDDEDVTQPFFFTQNEESADSTASVTEKVSVSSSVKNPVVGWLVCTEGGNRGKSYEIHMGKNFIGRSPEMDICIDGDVSISRKKHAAIIYEPKARIFFAQTGESHELFYLNDQVVLSNLPLNDRDEITIGNTKLIFVPFCDGRFGWM